MKSIAKMLIYTKVIFAILIFLSVGSGNSCQTKETNQLTTQELEVYKTILSGKSKEIVVIDETKVDVMGEISTGVLKETLRGLQNDTFDNFVKVNSTPSNIEDSIQTAFDYPIISKADFEKKNLEPSRYYVFSRVGFSNDRKQAVVIFIDVCEPLCSKGTYYLLTKQNGFWEITQESVFMRS